MITVVQSSTASCILPDIRSFAQGDSIIRGPTVFTAVLCITVAYIAKIDVISHIFISRYMGFHSYNDTDHPYCRVMRRGRKARGGWVYYNIWMRGCTMFCGSVMAIAIAQGGGKELKEMRPRISFLASLGRFGHVTMRFRVNRSCVLDCNKY